MTKANLAKAEARAAEIRQGMSRELAAMADALELLGKLTPAEQARAIRWLDSRVWADIESGHRVARSVGVFLRAASL